MPVDEIKYSDLSEEAISLTSKFLKQQEATVNGFAYATGLGFKTFLDTYYSKEFVRVGTVNADYATIQLALAASQYNIQLITDVTETVGWGTHTGKVITIIGDVQERTINMSVANTGVYNIYANNVKFSITGTNTIFKNNTSIYIQKGTLQGDSSANVFLSTGCLSANNLTINTGTNGTFTISSLNNINNLVINFQSAVQNCLIAVNNGLINYLSITGTGNSALEGGLRLSGNVTINHFANTSSGTYPLTFAGTNSKILSSSGTGFNIYATAATMTGSFLNKCTIITATIVDANIVFNNCTITTLTPSVLAVFKNFTNNTVTNNCTLSLNDNEINGCTFSGNLIVSGDNNNFSNTRITGTLTINSGADGNIFNNPRVTSTTSVTGDYNKFVNGVFTGLLTLASGAEYNVISGNTLTGGLTNSSGNTTNEINNNI